MPGLLLNIETGLEVPTCVGRRCKKPKSLANLRWIEDSSNTKLTEASIGQFQGRLGCRCKNRNVMDMFILKSVFNTKNLEVSIT